MGEKVVKSKEDYLKEWKDAYKYHVEQADFFKDLLNQYADEKKMNRQLKELSDLSSVKVIKSPPPNINSTNDKNRFWEVVADVLRENDRPMYIGEIMKGFHKKKGYVIERKNFSSQLRSTQKRHGFYESAEYPQFPFSKRFWWGLSEWFSGSKFKKVYEDKILEQMKDQNRTKASQLAFD